MSVRSRDALCAPNPLQVHAHTTLQGTLFGCTPRSLSQAFYAVPQALAPPSAQAPLRILRRTPRTSRLKVKGGVRGRS